MANSILDPNAPGDWGSDARKAFVSGQPVRTSFLDESDFNRYYGLDKVQSFAYTPQYGYQTTEDTFIKAPVWDNSMAIQAMPPPAAPPPPASSAPPPPGGANAPPPAAPPSSGGSQKEVPTVPQYKAETTAISGGGSIPKPGDAGWTGVTYTPEEWQAILASVNAPTDTVKGQMEGLLAENSPYLQLARQGALTTANARGLLNSSIAAGAGEKSAIEAALPIANADAQIYSQQRLANQTVQNQAGQFNAGEANKALALKANADNALTQAGYQAMVADIAAANQAARQDTLNANQAERDKEKMSFDEGIKTRLAALSQDYALELEGMKQTYQIAQNRDTAVAQMYSDLEKSIATLLNRAELTPEQQSSGAKLLIDTHRAGLEYLTGVKAPEVPEYKSSTSYVPPTG